MNQRPRGRRQYFVGGVVALLISVGATHALPAHGHGYSHRNREKISAKASEQANEKGASTVDVIVRFRQAPGNPEHELVRGFGGRVGHHFRPSSRWMAVRIPAAKLEELGRHPAVEFVASDAAVRSKLDVARQAADAPPLGVAENVLKGAGVTIAEVDSGVAPHPGIQTLIAAVDFVGSYDPSFSPANSVDPNGHGTHVAGILVGTGSNSDQNRLAGIAPQASLVSVRVLDGNGGGKASDVLAGLQWVLANKSAFGIRVVNLSLGHPVYEPAALDPLVQEVDSLWDAGIVVVCSAGNDGRSGDGTISSPCNSRKVITVGALNDQHTPDTADDTVASYSSRGPTRLDLVAKPDLLAPGNRIVSARAAGSYLDLMFPDRRVAGDPAQPNDLQYFELSGTSMAAPMVSGTAALMIEQEPGLNPGTVKARLMLSATKAAVGSPFTVGAGALDILGALRATGQVADAPSPLVSADAATGQLVFENPAVLWSNSSFSLMTLWSPAILWTDPTQWNQPLVSSYGVLSPDTTVSPYVPMFPTVVPTATIWPESILWSEAVIWPDGPADMPVDSLDVLVDDP
ncbi:MAG TPA: S8 family peptidase [Vicinamibacteria bacterium]|jgi:serine protease AprX|nr:S8 family peptidase [Vicinamibacteria bacterium]